MHLVEVPAEFVITAADRRAIRLGYGWSQEAVDHVVAFFRTFLVVRSEGYTGPFVLEDWQYKAIARMYGWRRPDGRRRFTEVYINICKKNGKSLLLAGLALYGMMNTPAAEVYQGALNRKQAGVLFRQAARLIKHSPLLKDLYVTRNYNRTITLDANDARLESLSADADSSDGVDSSMTIFDEIHRWGSKDELYKVMRGAGAARREPLIVHLTTAGDESSTFCRELHSRAQAILDGDDSDLAFLGIIYALSPGDDHSDESTWIKANPSLNTILNIEVLREEYARYKRIPARFSNWLRLHMCLCEMSINPWLEEGLWQEAACPEVRGLDWWKGRDVAVGIDLSTTKDLTALTMTTLHDGKLYWRSDYFLPEDTIEERSENDGVKYDEWSAENRYAHVTPGNATDFEYIRRYVNQLRDDLEVNIYAIGIDPWNHSTISSGLIDDGFDVDIITQSTRNYNPAAREVERRLLNGTLQHDDSPITHWCINNTRMVSDSYGQIRPSKKGAEKLRIDGTAAGLMSVGMLLKKPAPPSYRIFTA